MNESDIVYSRSVKAGRRMYYLDAKEDRSGDLYICMTESKRIDNPDEGSITPRFEKHKIFLYKEDIQHFSEALNDLFDFVRNKLGNIEPRIIAGEEKKDVEA